DGILGSSVLWFQRDDQRRPLPAARWRDMTMASISTHDLPTAAGYLAGEHVRVRAELEQLGRSRAAEDAEWRRDAAGLLGMLRAEGLLAGPAGGADGSEGLLAGPGGGADGSEGLLAGPAGGADGSEQLVADRAGGVNGDHDVPDVDAVDHTAAV